MTTSSHHLIFSTINLSPKNGAGYAEYAAIPWASAIPLPASISTRIGAASFLQGTTALAFAHEAYAVQKGDWILIHAVAGGFGLQLTQVCTSSLAFQLVFRRCSAQLI